MADDPFRTKRKRKSTVTDSAKKRRKQTYNIEFSKVKLQLETYEGQTITAELLSGRCKDDLPCSRLEHTFMHSDTQTYLTFTVHPAEQHEKQIFVTGVLVFILSCLLLTWMVRKWMKWKPGEDSEEKKEVHAKLESNQEVTDEDKANHRNQNDSSLSYETLPDSSFTMTWRRHSQASRCTLVILCSAILGLLGLSTMVLMYGAPRGEQSEDLPVLRLRFPEDKLIRHIRSYSKDPDIKDVNLAQDGAKSSLVTRLQLLDLSPDCRSNLTGCRTHALCDTPGPDGELKCRCNRGFYLKDLKCTPCQTTCQDGFYMTKQCSATQDVECKPCTQCEGSSYEVAVCTSTQDTICIDVTFPLKQFQSRGITMEDLVQWNVTMSKNVFLERLQGIRKLETPLYLSSNRQALQFLWRRPNSGLEINVKVTDVYLIPEYVDIDHIDDAKFIEENQYPQNVTNQLAFIRNKNCRYPIPDEYDLNLEFADNVLTEAVEQTCNSRNRFLQGCPPGYSDGDKYILRKLNTSCRKTNTTSDIGFTYGSNNILCLGNNELLGVIFKKKVEDPTDLTFPTRECKESRENCGKCLSQQACDPMSKSNETDCCNLKCHQRPECKQYFSDTCPYAPVECTKGMVSKFSIMPRFQSINKQFSCHLRYKPPQYLYQLSYEVTIPSLQFSLGTRNKDVLYKNFTDHQNGFDQVDYLMMTHHTESKYDDEVILVGTFGDHEPRQVDRYTLHKLKDSETFDQYPGFTIDPVGRSKYRTKIQFEKPFLYSTASWFRDSCQKNVSKIYPAQPLYVSNGMAVKSPINKPNSDGKFVYQIMTEDAVPHMRFSIPENMSILSYYRDTYSTVRVNPWDIQGEIRWNVYTRHWNVTISGSLTACPGIFTLEIYTESTDTLLASYDMLISCPKEFATTFEIERNSVDFVDIFVVVLNDSVASYRIVLSSIQGPQYFQTIAKTDDIKESGEPSPWIPILVILSVCLSASMILTIIYIYYDKQKSEFIPTDISVPKPDLGPQITLLQSIYKTDKNKGLSLKTKCVMLTLVILYVAYAFIFTFLAIFGLFHLIQGSALYKVTLATNTSTQVQFQMQRTLDEIVQYEDKEINRMLKLTKQRLDACSHHLKTAVYENVPNGNSKLQNILRQIFQKDGSMKKNLAEYLSSKQSLYQREVDKFLEEFNQTLDAKLHKIQIKYSTDLKALVESKWLTFPKEIYMQQEIIKGRPMSKVTDNLTGFLRWLEIDKVQEIFDMREILMNRLQQMMPKVNFSSLLNDTEYPTQASVNIDFRVSNNTFKFSSNNPDYTPVRSFSDDDESLYNNDDEIFKKKNLFNVASIKGIIYPVFICTFLVLDSFLLFYRFSWLIKSLKIFKTGLEEKIPYDNVTRKIHFILTGKKVPKPEDSLDRPYDYYMHSNKDNMWSDQMEQYFLFCGTNSDKARADILREVWQHKQQINPRPEPAEKDKKCCNTCVSKFAKTTYRLFISPVFWRLALIFGFVLILCLVAKATNDLVTLESAMFLLDTDAMLPILERQNGITNDVISHYESYLNEFLTGYKENVDGEVQVMNNILLNVAERQNLLLNTMISEVCNLVGQTSCVGGVDLVANSVTSCNFLPIHSKPFEGFHESVLLEYIQLELSPLVSSLRNILFNSLYLFLLCAAVMVVCQILARVIFTYLKNSRHVKLTKIYQLPSRCEFPDDQQALQKDNQSVIAESCESGVYDMTN